MLDEDRVTVAPRPRCRQASSRPSDVRRTGAHPRAGRSLVVKGRSPSALTSPTARPARAEPTEPAPRRGGHPSSQAWHGSGIRSTAPGSTSPSSSDLSRGGRQKLDTVRIVSTELRRLASLVTDFLDFAPQAARRHFAERAGPVRTGVARVSAANRRRRDRRDRSSRRRISFSTPTARISSTCSSTSSRTGSTRSAKREVVLRARREPRYACIEVGTTGRVCRIGRRRSSTHSIRRRSTGRASGWRSRIIVSTDDGHLDFDSRRGCTHFVSDYRTLLIEALRSPVG